MKLLHPLPVGVPTSPFGWRTISGVRDYHRGQDWKAAIGTPILAAHSGTVRYTGYDSKGGWWLILTSDDGKWETTYQHMRAKSPLQTGSRVGAGQVVGYVGSTGWSTGPHLHFELWEGIAHRGGSAVNPIPFLTQTTPMPEYREEEGDDVKYIGSYIENPEGKRAEDRSCVIYDPRSGFYTTWSGVPQGYTNEMARAFNTGNFNWVTRKHWEQTIKPQLDKLLAK